MSLLANECKSPRGLLAAAALCLASVPAHALVIVPTFDADVSADARSAFNFAANELQGLFSDPVTVNIQISTGATGLSESVAPVIFGNADTYADARARLMADQSAYPSPDGALSIAPNGSTASAIDPTNGGAFFYTTAQAKALGIIPANSPGIDGTFSYNSTLSYVFDPAHRAGLPGQFDFITLAEHEVTEIMGRITGLGGNVCANRNCGPDFTPLDLFRFTAPGVHALSDVAGAYFSIDNGATRLRTFNFAGTNGGDPHDWDSSDPNDPFNAFIAAGIAHALSPADITALDVIGWDNAAAIAAIPEPDTYAMLLAGLGVLGVIARRRKSEIA